MMEKILLGSSYLAQAIVMATIAFAVKIGRAHV